MCQLVFSMIDDNLIKIKKELLRRNSHSKGLYISYEMLNKLPLTKDYYELKKSKLFLLLIKEGKIRVILRYLVLKNPELLFLNKLGGGKPRK